MQIGNTYNFGGNNGGGGDSCPCAFEEITVDRFMSPYALDLSDADIAKWFIIVEGTVQINLPAIAAVGYRAMDITFTVTAANTFTLHPNAADQLGTFSVGADMVVSGQAGQTIWLRIGADNIWAVSSTSNVAFAQVLQITAADFTGDDYQNDLLIGKDADIGFLVFADGGSGTLQKVNDGYTFNDVTGTITIAGGGGDFRIEIV
jgi:hypothetical protein